MDLQNVSNRYFTLDEVLKDIPENVLEEPFDIEEAYESYKEELNQELKTTDRVWLDFQAGQCEIYGHAAKNLLYRIVKASVNHPENSQAAANAITILKVMNVSLSSLDLKGIQVPGADLSEAILDDSDLSNAILNDVNLMHASLNRTNLSQANLEGIELGVKVLVQFTEKLKGKATISPNAKYIVFKELGTLNVLNIDTNTKHQVSLPTVDSKWFKARFIFDGAYFITDDCNDETKLRYVTIWQTEPVIKINEIEITYTSKSSHEHSLFEISHDEKFLIMCDIFYEKQQLYTKLNLFNICNEIINKPELRQYKNTINQGYISKLCYSPKGSFVAGLFANREAYYEGAFILVFFDGQTFEELARFEEKESKFYPSLLNNMYEIHLAFTPDEKSLLMSYQNSVYQYDIWDTDKKQLSFDTAKRRELFSDFGKIQYLQFIENSSILGYVNKNHAEKHSIVLRDISNAGKIIFQDQGFDDTYVSIQFFMKKNCIIEVYKNKILSRKIQHNNSYSFQKKAARILSTGFVPNSNMLRTLSTELDTKNITDYNIFDGRQVSHIALELKSRIDGYSYDEDYAKHFTSSGQYIEFKKLDKTQYMRGLELFVSLDLLSIANKNNSYTYKGAYRASASSGNGEFAAFLEEGGIAVRRIQSTITNEFFLPVGDIPENEVVCIVISQHFSLLGGYIALSNQSDITIWKLVGNGITLSLDENGAHTIKRMGSKWVKLYFVRDDQLLVIIEEETLSICDLKQSYHIQKLECALIDESQYMIQHTSLFPNCFDIALNGEKIIAVDESLNEDVSFKKSCRELCLWDKALGKKLFSLEIPYKKDYSYASVGISSGSRFFVKWEYGSPDLQVWQIFNNTFRLLSRFPRDLENFKINLQDTKGLSPENEAVLLLPWGYRRARIGN